MTMADREWQDTGEPVEMETGGISPVIGDIERTTTSEPTSGGGTPADTVTQAVRGLKYR